MYIHLYRTNQGPVECYRNFHTHTHTHTHKRDNSDSSRVRIDLQRLVSDDDLRTSFQDRTFFRLALRVAGRATGESAAELTAAVLSAAAETAPLARRERGQRGWCSPAVQLEITEMSREIKAARQQRRGAPGNRELNRRVSKALKKRDQVREKALEAFFESYVRRLHKARRGRDQVGFYQSMNGIQVEARRSVTSQNIKDKDGKVVTTVDGHTYGKPEVEEVIKKLLAKDDKKKDADKDKKKEEKKKAA